MRKIMFRGYTGRSWIYGLPNRGARNWTLGDYTNGWQAVKEDSIGQYTGLQDSNYRDIYEGDILFNGDENAVVEYVDDRFVAAMQGVIESVIDFDGVVIGNVYENPELVLWYTSEE